MQKQDTISLGHLDNGVICRNKDGFFPGGRHSDPKQIVAPDAAAGDLFGF